MKELRPVVEVDFLESYADAWNARDIDRIMQAMSPDCVFETAGGNADCGVRSVGQNAVRDRFVTVWSAMPTAEWIAEAHFVRGCRCCSEWVFRGEDHKGREVRFSGCDFFTFSDGKIRVKHTVLESDPNLGSVKNKIFPMVGEDDAAGRD